MMMAIRIIRWILLFLFVNDGQDSEEVSVWWSLVLIEGRLTRVLI